MSRFARCTTLTLIAVAGFVGTQAGAQPAEPIGDLVEIRAKLGPVDQPDLGPLDPTVAQQLTQARHEMETAIADPTAGTRELAATYGSLGQVYHAYELLDTARQCYDNAIALEPQNFAWLHLQGDVSRLQGRLEDAAMQFQSAWALEPRDFAAVVNIADIMLELDRGDEARTMYQQALSMSPGSPSVMAGLGQLALRDKSYVDAVAFFNAALAAVPDANRLHYSLAMAYRGLGEMDKAKEHLALRGTVGIRPPDPLLAALQPLREGERVHLVRGRMAFAAERYGEAEREFELAVEADPRSVRALVNLGAVRAKQGDREAAVELFTKALAIDDSNPTANFNLGTLLARSGATDEAIQHLQRSIDKEPDDAGAQLALARALVASGDDESAIPHFRKAAKLDSSNPRLFVEGPATLVRLKRFEEAVSVLEAGHELHPDDAAITFALARMLAACPDANLRNGKRAHTLALEIHEKAPNPRYTQLVAQSLAELNRCTEAAEWQEKVVSAAREDGQDEIAEILATDLEAYRQGPPCRPPVAPSGS